MAKLYYTIFYGLALFFIAYLGVDIFYKIVLSKLGQSKTEEIAIEEIGAIDHHRRSPLAAYSVITERNLFGSLEVSAAREANEDIENLTPTSLKVALLGTVAGDKDKAFAVIEDMDEKKEDLYRVGDEIQGAVIKQILRGKVVLSIDGQDEILTMGESRTSQSAADYSPFASTPTGATIMVKRSELENSLKNINRLISEARIVPHFGKDGKADGLSISRIKRGSVFEKLGLRNGDIVQGIDGSPIKSPDDVLSLYSKLKAGSSVSLDLIRDDNQEKIEYQFK